MAEMTHAELTGAIKALEAVLNGSEEFMRMGIGVDLQSYRTQLAAQPPAVDRERRLREAVEAALEAHLRRHSIDAKLCSALNAALADQPPPDSERLLQIQSSIDRSDAERAMDKLYGQPPPDPRESALDDAEKALKSMVKLCRAEWFLEDIPITKSPIAEIVESEAALATIRAARGKA